MVRCITCKGEKALIASFVLAVIAIIINIGAIWFVSGDKGLCCGDKLQNIDNKTKHKKLSVDRISPAWQSAFCVCFGISLIFLTIAMCCLAATVSDYHNEKWDKTDSRGANDTECEATFYEFVSCDAFKWSKIDGSYDYWGELDVKTDVPTLSPTLFPTKLPTDSPTERGDTPSPSDSPTLFPTFMPTDVPTDKVYKEPITLCREDIYNEIVTALVCLSLSWLLMSFMALIWYQVEFFIYLYLNLNSCNFSEKSKNFILCECFNFNSFVIQIDEYMNDRIVSKPENFRWMDIAQFTIHRKIEQRRDYKATSAVESWWKYLFMWRSDTKTYQIRLDTKTAIKLHDYLTNATKMYRIRQSILNNPWPAPMFNYNYNINRAWQHGYHNQSQGHGHHHDHHFIRARNVANGRISSQTTDL